MSSVDQRPDKPISSSNRKGYQSKPQRMAATIHDKAGKIGDLCWADMSDSIYLAVFCAKRITQ